jgi:hypothetical protein
MLKYLGEIFEVSSFISIHMSALRHWSQFWTVTKGDQSLKETMDWNLRSMNDTAA